MHNLENNLNIVITHGEFATRDAYVDVVSNSLREQGISEGMVGKILSISSAIAEGIKSTGWIELSEKFLASGQYTEQPLTFPELGATSHKEYREVGVAITSNGRVGRRPIGQRSTHGILIDRDKLPRWELGKFPDLGIARACALVKDAEGNELKPILLKEATGEQSALHTTHINILRLGFVMAQLDLKFGQHPQV